MVIATIPCEARNGPQDRTDPSEAMKPGQITTIGSGPSSVVG